MAYLCGGENSVTLYKLIHGSVIVADKVVVNGLMMHDIL